MRSRRFLGLVGCGLVLLALTGVGLYEQRQHDLEGFVAVALAQGAVYLVAAGLVWRAAASRLAVAWILAAAAALRIAVILAPPYLSNDIYRYVWDGRVVAAGINPYRYIPADPHLARLRDRAIFPHINRNNYARTIYPPAAEAIFFAVTRVSESLVAMKAAMVVCEAVAAALLLGLLAAAPLPATRIILYAWHPLPLWEFAGSGHIDAAIVALVALALWSRFHFPLSYRRRPVSPAEVGPGLRRDDDNGGGRGWLAGLALAAGTLVKLYPAVLLPAFRRRGDWRLPTVFAAALVAAYLPFLGVGWKVLGFLPGYLREEGFAAGGAGAGFYLWSVAKSLLPPLRGVSDVAYMILAAALLATLAVYVIRKRSGGIAGTALLSGAFMLLWSPHYPWYFAWLIVLACVVPAASLVWLTLASFLLYLAPVGSQLVWDRRRFVVESVLYGPFLMLAATDLWRQRRRELPTHGQPATR